MVDAPASGHGIGMLTTPRTFGEIARVGPIRRQAYKVSEMLADPARTGYVAVALPEEMPVNETIELERRLRDAVGLGLDAIVMNAMWPERFSAADVTKLRAATRDGHAPDELGAVRAALAAHERVKAQRAHLRRLEARDRRADHARCRSSSSPSSSSPHYEQLAARSSWHERARAAASPPSRAGSGGCTQLAFWGARAVAGVIVAVIVDGGGPWSWVVPLVLGAAVVIVRPGAALARAGAGTSPTRASTSSTATLTINRTLVPWVRVQHVETRRGLFEQAFGLATVIVHNAAGCAHDPAAARRPTPRSCASGSPAGADRRRR